MQPRVSHDPMNLFEERKSTFYWPNRYYDVHYKTDGENRVRFEVMILMLKDCTLIGDIDSAYR